MTTAVRELRNVSLAFEGHFNPLIVQPDWLLAQGLIDEKDRESVLESEQAIVTPEYAAIRLPWLVLEITRDSAYLSSTRESETLDRVREIAIGLFSSLPHTPITSINVAYSWHMYVEQDRWTELLEALAPAGPFVDVLNGEIAFDTLRQRAPYEDHRLTITLQPSRLEGLVAFLQVDSEWPIPEHLAQNAGHALSLLDGHWDEMRHNAERIRNTIFDV